MNSILTANSTFGSSQHKLHIFDSSIVAQNDDGSYTVKLHLNESNELISGSIATLSDFKTVTSLNYNNDLEVWDRWDNLNNSSLEDVIVDDDGYITIHYSSFRELIFGKTIYFNSSISIGSRVCFANVAFAEEDAGNLIDKVDDSESGIYIDSKIPIFAEELKLNVYKNVVSDDPSKGLSKEKYELYNSSMYKNPQWYTVSLENSNLKKDQKFYLHVPIPDDFNIDKYFIDVIVNGDTEITSYKFFSSSFHKVEDGWLIRIGNFDNATIVIAESAKSDNVHDIKEDGIYKANIQLVQQGKTNLLSMADNAVIRNENGENVRTVYIVVEDNTKKVYFKSGTVSKEDVEAYVGAYFCNKIDEEGSVYENSISYTDFLTNESGDLVDNTGYDAVTEWACVKGGILTLMDESYIAENNVYELCVASPVMARIGGEEYDNLSPDSLKVWARFSDVEKCNTAVNINTIKKEYGYKPSALLRAIKRAQSEKLYDPDLYTTESYNNLMSACDLAQTVYEATFSDTVTASNAYEEQINLVQAAIDALVLDESAIGDKTELEALVAKAKAIKADEYTNSSYAALTEAIEAAEKVLAKDAVKQSRLDEQVKALQAAINALEKKPETALDKDNLADGKYTLTAEMIKTDRKSKSMSNNAINHTVQLEVENGEYFVTVQFKGLAIYNQFGYLKDLSYYDAGYTYNDYGIPQGKVVPAEVLSTYDVVDQYNDADNLYPQLLKFKLVDKASADFVPLQVFVPIMEAIAEGTGTQDVLMQLDWSTLVKVDDDAPIEIEEPEEQSPAVDLTDAATGVKIHADKGVFAEGIQLVVTPVTSGSDYDNAKKALDSTAKAFNLYEIHFIDKDGNIVQPNGTVSVSIPVPDDYSDKLAVYRINDNAGKTLMSGEAKDGYYTYLTKSFSLYALADTNVTAEGDSDTPADTTPDDTTPSDNAPANDNGTGNPKTGAAATGFAGIAFAGAALILTRRKEK